MNWRTRDALAISIPIPGSWGECADLWGVGEGGLEGSWKVPPKHWHCKMCYLVRPYAVCYNRLKSLVSLPALGEDWAIKDASKRREWEEGEAEGQRKEESELRRRGKEEGKMRKHGWSTGSESFQLTYTWSNVQAKHNDKYLLDIWLSCMWSFAGQIWSISRSWLALFVAFHIQFVFLSLLTWRFFLL